jgi:hypothetical protein
MALKATSSTSKNNGRPLLTSTVEDQVAEGDRVAPRSK